jgi:hypothetical protein
MPAPNTTIYKCVKRFGATGSILNRTRTRKIHAQKERKKERREKKLNDIVDRMETTKSLVRLTQKTGMSASISMNCNSTATFTFQTLRHGS